METALWVLAYLVWCGVSSCAAVWLFTREPKQKT